MGQHVPRIQLREGEDVGSIGLCLQNVSTNIVLSLKLFERDSSEAREFFDHH
jgi:hypothetical protein